MAQYGIRTDHGILPVYDVQTTLAANSQLYPVASYIDSITPNIYDVIFGEGNITPAKVLGANGLLLTNNTPTQNQLILTMLLKSNTDAELSVKCTVAGSRWNNCALFLEPKLIGGQTYQSYDTSGFSILTGQTNKLFCVHYSDGLDKSIYVFILCAIEGNNVFRGHVVLNEAYMQQNYLCSIYADFFADSDFTDTTSTEEGYKGKGAHDHTSDKISAASDPVVSTSQLGFFHIYHVSSGSLSALGQYLFPDILSSLVNADLEGILRAFASIFAYRDNIQYIVDLHAIPVAPTDGAGAYVKVGALETDINVPAVVSDYVNFDCGSLSIPENFASFLDYTHTRAKLFLPGVGFVDIKNEFWQSGVLNVKYKFNVVDGSFMCFVSATSSKSQLEETVIGQYGGTMCIHFPVMSQSYGAMMSGIVSGAAMISTGGAAEAAAMQQGKTAAAAAAQQTKAQGYFSALQAAPLQKTAQSSNSYNSSTSFLGNRTPYLMIERAVPNFSAFYNIECGVPLNVTTPLATVHGYTEIENIVFAGQTFATDEEIADIKEKLRNGVIF